MSHSILLKKFRNEPIILKIYIVVNGILLAIGLKSIFERVA